MAHTLLEQTLNLSENTVDDIHNLFVQQFGYTQNGNYYFSPVDTNFGVRWYISNNYLYCNVTFDCGATENVFLNISISYGITKINYHVSNGEKAIYLRIYYQPVSGTDYIRSIEIVIAHDDINKTICFRGAAISNGSSSDGTVYMMDNKKSLYTFDLVANAYEKINSALNNAIFHCPSISNGCMISELYCIFKIQTFPSLNNTFINFNGQIYRIIGCFNQRINDVNYIPYFAFPVSD